jgi:hypothetical protein
MLLVETLQPNRLGGLEELIVTDEEVGYFAYCG